MYNLNRAAWNLRTILEKSNSKRKSVLISKELQKYHIAALSEVRFAESDSIRGETSYTDLSGKTSTDRIESGVIFAVRNGLLSNTSEDPKPVGDRFIMLWLLLFDNRYCTLIAAYDRTMTNRPEKNKHFLQPARSDNP